MGIQKQKRARQGRNNNLSRGDRVNGVKTVNPVDPHARDALIRNSCFSCRGTRFWISQEGVSLCARCHPPISDEIVQEWLEVDTER